LIFSEIRRCVAWNIVGLLAGQELDQSSTNPCPKEDDFCLSCFADCGYE